MKHDTDSEVTSVIDLGGVVTRGMPSGSIAIDRPLDPDLEMFLDGVFTGLEKTGGMPGLLFVALAGSGYEGIVAAVGLARAAMKRSKVLLVDACFDEPALQKPFPYQPDEGLTDMVLWGSSVEATLRKTSDDRMQVITVGSPPPNPIDFFLENDVDAVLNTLREQAPFVLIAAPLKSETGAVSPLLRRADRTLVILGEKDNLSDLREQLPVGRVTSITLAGAVAGNVEENQVEGMIGAPRETLPESDQPRFPASAGESAETESAVSGMPAGAGASVSKEKTDGPAADAPARAARSGKGAAPPSTTRPKSSRPSPRTASAGKSPSIRSGANEKAKLPLGRIALGFVAVCVVAGLLLSFVFMRDRFELPTGGTRLAGREPATVTTGTISPAVQKPSKSIAAEGEETKLPDDPSPIREAALESEAKTPDVKTSEVVTASVREEPKTEKPAARSAVKPPVAESVDKGTTGQAGGTGEQSIVQEKSVRRTPPPAGQKLYGVHVESFPTNAEAVETSKHYSDAGVTVTIMVADVPGKGIWHRIILGRFSSRSEAYRFSEEVKERFQLTYALVVRVSS